MELLARIRSNFAFSWEEWKALLIMCAAFAFIYSFDQWDATNASIGFISLFIAFVIALVSVFAHHALQRIWGLYEGFKIKQELWWYGILTGLVLVVISNGNIKFLAASGTFIFMNEIWRLGQYRYGLSFWGWARICFMGVLANLLLATWAKMLMFSYPDNVFFSRLFYFNMIMAFCNLIPIPPLDGFRIMYISRLFYAFAFGCIGGYFVLTMLGIYSYLLALVIGIIVWLLTLTYIE